MSTQNKDVRYEEIIKVTKYEKKADLPDLFRFNDGSRVRTAEEWSCRRAEIYKNAVELQYGTIPPAPLALDIETIYLGGAKKTNCYRLTAHTPGGKVTMSMTVFKAASDKPLPTVITGDHCFPYAYDKEYVSTFIDNGINLALFNRTELAPDMAGYNVSELDGSTREAELARGTLAHILDGNCGGVLKAAYPEYTFGAIGAWAWGYSRCVDALIELGVADPEMIVFTGHSRGGKTAALAGAIDERAAIVNPNETCAGACSSYRISIEALTEDGDIKPSETLTALTKTFPSWLGSGMRSYAGREEELPFDSHDLKALIAPRVLFVSEAASDIWANPVGSYQTTEAAGEVFRFLGCEDNLFWYYRRGYHYQKTEDIAQLVNIIRHKKYGEPLNDKFFVLPFKPIEKAYTWEAPKKQ